ncbi:hypothetical protein TREVI0001_1642 [Treponema vincentii ATCC 35580]|uniref:Uncharacterized protein n=1 Tax=Treponema vincentii ATCC 35580 TaxID=596324 RepID=C8PQR5_9SPIR|nr:hypothetical protein TREVI0001_1642 [Treponema vincentii ATCC 35580]
MQLSCILHSYSRKSKYMPDKPPPFRYNVRYEFSLFGL